MIPRGRPVTIVCRAPAGFEDSRLEKEGSSQIWDKKNSSPSEREARFLFPSMSEDTAGRYRCRYLKSTWSELSEDLRLVLSREDVTQVTTPVPAQPSGRHTGTGVKQVSSVETTMISTGAAGTWREGAMTYPAPLRMWPQGRDVAPGR
uniref:Ig-like domain-containing protein n=1 Tax=Marmota marmota marmota TaxID=9994 RepID=A0A8C5YQL9_MARMA